MKKTKKKNYHLLLNQLGFSAVESAPQEFELLRKSNSSSSYLPMLLKQENPWDVKKWRVRLNGNQIETLNLEVELNLSIFCKNIVNLIDAEFCDKVTVEAVPAKDGSVWLFCENMDESIPSEIIDNVRTPRMGVAGFNFRFYPKANQVYANTSKHFGLGFLPDQILFSAMSKIRLAGFGGVSPGDCRDSENIFECEFPLILLASSGFGVSDSEISPSQMFASVRIDGSLEMSPSGEGINFVYSNQAVVGLSAYNNYAGTPMEVLETREYQQSYRSLERLFLQNNYDAALEQLKTALLSDQQNLYLVRRACLFCLPVFNEIDSFWSDSYLKHEPENLLFLSYRICHSKDSEKIRNHWSEMNKLYETLESILPEFDSIKCLQVVLPYYYAEAIREENPEKAKRLVEGVLEKRGPRGFIFDWLANFENIRNDIDAEARYLKKWAEIEKEPMVAAKVFFRLMVSNFNREIDEDGIISGLECLKREPSNAAAAIITSQLFSRNGRNESALDVLTSTVDCLQHSSKDRYKLSRLEVEIAKVWRNGFCRSDLSVKHIRRALKHNPKNLEALQAKCQLFEEKQNFVELAETLEDLLSSLEDRESIDKIGKELVLLYKDKLNDPEKMLKVYLNPKIGFEIAPDDLVEAIESNLSLDWEEMYRKLESSVRGESVEEYSRRLILMARICREKLHDPKRAVDHLMEANLHGFVDASLFNYMIEQLQKLGKNNEVAIALKEKIGHQVGVNQIPVIRELLSLPDGLSEDERDQFALKIYELDESENKELFKRFNEYKSGQFWDRLEVLADRILSQKNHAIRSDFWLELIIETFKDLRSNDRYRALDKYLKQRVVYNPGDLHIIESAINILSESPNLGILQFYFEELIRQGILPNYDFKDILSVLEKDSVSVGKLYYFQAQQETDSRLAAKFAKKSSKIFSKHLNEHFNEERSFGLFCSLIPCEPIELEHFKNLVTRSGNWPFYVRVLTKQIEVSMDSEWRFSLWVKIAEIYEGPLANPMKALDAYEKSRSIRLDSRVDYCILENLDKIGDEEKFRTFLLNRLGDEEFVKDTEAVAKFVRKLSGTAQESEKNQGGIIEQIDRLHAAGNEELAGEISEVLIRQGNDSNTLHKYAFVSAVARNDEMAISKYLASVISSCYSVDEVSITLEWAKGRLDESFSNLNWEELLGTSIEVIDFEKMTVAIGLELKLLIGLTLFNSDRYTDKAIKLLAEVKRSNPAETRVWMPLYLLMREYGNDREVKAYLLELIPLAESNPEITRNFPVTLESLRAELGHGGDFGEVLQRSSIKNAVGFESMPVVNHIGSNSLVSVDNTSTDFKSISITDNYWKEILRTLNYPSGALESLFDKAFSSALEKHVALQGVALLSGEIDFLKRWHWQVWADPNQYGYPLQGRKRFPESGTPKPIDSTIHRMITLLTPALVKFFSVKFSKQGLAGKLGLGLEELSRRAKKINWSHKAFKDTAMIHYRQNIEKMKFQIYDCSGLGEELFYEGKSRAFYIDIEAYKNVTPVILFHRIFAKMWAVKLNYFIPLQLDPQKHVSPFLAEVKKVVNANPIKAFAYSLGLKQNRVANVLRGIDRSELQRLFGRLGRLQGGELDSLWQAMHAHIYRLMIAETLDVIGIFESICGKDLVNKERFGVGQILHYSSHFRSLLGFLTTLK